MNFYTLISKQTIYPKKWILISLSISILISINIFIFNFIIDPYNMTNYNLLNIKHKFARDDRTDKLNHFKTLKKFDNIMIGSSRVYSINPQKVSDILGGTTYNFAFGTATVEDHLGTIKYLKRDNKLPKNIIIGVDFYTFNPRTPANKYFLKNKELNFLSYSNYDENYLGKFFSLDSFRASFKTLKNHLKKSSQRPSFNHLGWGSSYSSDSLRNTKEEEINTIKEANKEIPKIYSNYEYTKIDKRRVSYYEEIRKICKENSIKLYIFTTPLHPILLDDLMKNDTKYALNEMTEYLSSFENFTNLYNNKKIYTNLLNFQGATHTTANAGDIILDIALNPL